MSIRPFLSEGAYDPETVALLVQAFDSAWQTILRSGSPLAAEADKVREQLAKQIIAAAEHGERDPHRLVEHAVLQLTRKHDVRIEPSTNGSSG